MRAEDLSLADLSQGMEQYPQTMVNVPVASMMQQNQLDSSMAGLVADAERALNGNGRVLLRPSGTEPLVRVMVEGQDPQLTSEVANRLAEQVAASL